MFSSFFHRQAFLTHILRKSSVDFNALPNELSAPPITFVNPDSFSKHRGRHNRELLADDPINRNINDSNERYKRTVTV